MPWILKDVVDAYGGKDMLISATLGDLPYKPSMPKTWHLALTSSGFVEQFVRLQIELPASNPSWSRSLPPMSKV